MKTRLLIATAVAVAACAPALAATGYSASQTSFEGYVRFVGEEFQLVDSQNRYVSGRTRPCVSGALPRDLQRQAARDIGGQKVRITGSTMAWSQDLPGDRYTHAGSNIRNECDSAFVILATNIDAIP